ncbi:Outer membrane protein OmpA [Lutimaribacter pacificus]|uniref:Outer membrane protein OmpA n=1 Tax=Lutimaribacter pacificus TaxID=391948 RepID=A0A1H0E338_9RHOB|nr:OmpA family protein [Lutimaribacter pacificus]SDN76832.1 Outer membrane protein OmpA [Lutimaribacter pacificus]SHK56956.1 Outer membrane protein OmpA [Lutimaribacter pacificus]
MIRHAVALVLCLAGTSVRALDLTLPGNARAMAETVSDPDSYALPTGPYEAGRLPVRMLEGAVSRQAWRIDGQGMTTLQIFAPLRAQLKAAGYELLFECADEDCGGFDFRFEIEVLPAPAMYVSLSDFRHLSARKGPEDHVSLLVSRTGRAGFVQLIRVAAPGDGAGAPGLHVQSAPGGAAVAGGGDLAQRLAGQGFAILKDLEFATGSSELSDGDYASLAALGAFMRDNPQARIALVGHTDAVGALDGNIALSKRRAASVLERLAAVHGIPRERMEADGMGYLSPIAPNTTPEGREANRRVEVILLNTE